MGGTTRGLRRPALHTEAYRWSHIEDQPTPVHSRTSTSSLLSHIMTLPLVAALAFALASPPPSRCSTRDALRRTRPASMQFGGLNPFRGKQDGATAFCLTLAFRTADRGPRSLLGQLDSLAADADTSSEDGIAALCADTALLLLRRKQEWLYCCGEAKDHGRDEAALERFDRLAIREAAKFDDRDSSATVDAALAAAGVTP